MINKNKMSMINSNGCTIILFKDNKKIGDIEAIAWTKDKKINGSLILKIDQIYKNPFSIIISMNTEDEKESRNYVIENVKIDFHNERNIFNFEASDIKNIS